MSETETIVIVLEGDDLTLYRKMMSMLPEADRTEKVNEKIFREGLINWAKGTIVGKLASQS